MMRKRERDRESERRQKVVGGKNMRHKKNIHKMQTSIFPIANVVASFYVVALLHSLALDCLSEAVFLLAVEDLSQYIKLK